MGEPSGEQIDEIGDELLLLPSQQKPPVFPWLAGAAGIVIAAASFFGVAKPAMQREQQALGKEAAALKQLEDASKLAATAKSATEEADTLRTENKKLNEELAKTVADKAADQTILDQLKQGVGAGADITGDGQRITVTMVDKILFKSAVADLTPEGEAVLAKIAVVLKGVDGKQIEVGGHADNTHVESGVKDKFPTNWELSTARATNVVRFLEEKGGIPGKRLKAAGYGSTRPVASNKSTAGRTKNRRIEILLLPDQKVVKGDFKDEIAAAPAATATPKPTATAKAPAKTVPLAAKRAVARLQVKKKK